VPTSRRRINERSLDRLRDRELDARDRALHAIAIARRDDISLTKAATRAGTDRRTVAKYAGPALEKRGSRWRILPYDRIQRRQWTTVIGSDGQLFWARVETRSSRMASELGTHTSDIEIALNPQSDPAARAGAAARLEERHGQRAGIRAFLPDGSVLSDPAFFGTPSGLADAYDQIDLAGLDFGSSATGRSR
jgi:hypothetical protein